jgi:hypothetical protein
MAYSAQKLITRSWYLSGIVARNLQVPTGDQINDGLDLLNSLLDFKQIETDLIPYYTYIEFPLVGGQEYYFLPNIAEIESSTFNIDVVRYPMDQTNRRTYFGTSRVDNIQTLPFNWNYNRGENGGTLSMYFLPQSNYPFKMMAKMFLSNVALQDDLTNIFAPLASGFVSSITVTNGGSGFTSIPTIFINGVGTGATAFASVKNGSITSISLVSAGSGYTQTPTVQIIGGGGSGAIAQANLSSYTFLQSNNAGYDKSYIEYLRYALAQYMCSEYGVEFAPQSEKILQKMQRELMYVSPPDLRRVGTSILTEVTGLNWGDVNIGKGWRPD